MFVIPPQTQESSTCEPNKQKVYEKEDHPPWQRRFPFSFTPSVTK